MEMEEHPATTASGVPLWCIGVIINIIGSVSITVIARLFIGWLCDRIGPRYSYTGLLLLGSIPVMGIGFAQNFETFLLFRVLIGPKSSRFQTNSPSIV